jgi:GMP synthase-like glutamine amidotransferase
MLNADIPVPNVFAHRAPTYGRIFHQLLTQASPPNVTITSTDFDVMKEQYPTSLAAFDAIIISGSANSSYDDLPWIRNLDAYIREVYEHHPRIKIFGSCFGHQLVCQSLLREYGVRVEKDPNGWEIGVKEVRLNRGFKEAIGERAEASLLHGRVNEGMRLQFVHHDHVVVPDIKGLPATWMAVGSTEHCAMQGIYEPGRVFTLQGHFEFDKFVNSECIKYFFSTSWTPECLREALENIDANDDSELATRMLLHFFLESNVVMDNTTYAVVDGLLTPPDE